MVEIHAILRVYRSCALLKKIDLFSPDNQLFIKR